MGFGRGNKIEISGKERRKTLVRIRQVYLQLGLVIKLIQHGMVLAFPQPGPRSEYVLPAVGANDIGVLLRVELVRNLMLLQVFFQKPHVFIMHRHQQLLTGAKAYLPDLRFVRQVQYRLQAYRAKQCPAGRLILTL